MIAHGDHHCSAILPFSRLKATLVILLQPAFFQLFIDNLPKHQ